MPRVEPELVKARAKRLRETCARRRDAWLQSLVGTRQRVLVEREDGSGHAENFAPVRVTGYAAVGGITEAVMTRVDNGQLIGATE